MKKNHIITLAIILGSLVIGGSTIGIVLINQSPDPPPADCETIHTSGLFTLFSSASASSKLEIINKIKNLNTAVSLLPESSENILEVTCEVTYFNWLLPDDYHFRLEISWEELDDFLIISIDFDNETIPTWVAHSNVTILLNPRYSEYKFSSMGEEGNLDVVFDTERELVFTKMEASTTGGDIYFQLNHTILNCGIEVESDQGDILVFLDVLPITGNIECQSLTGDVKIDIWDILFVENQSLTAIANKGTTTMRWAQHTAKNHNVSMTLESYYYCYLRVWCPFEFVRYDVTSEAYDRPEFVGFSSDLWVEIAPDRYVSSTFNDTTLDCFQATLKSSNFGTYTHLVDCFKPRRLCGQMPFLDTIGYDVIEAGDYALPNATFLGSNIVLTDYTAYANTTLNISTLEANSTNLFETSWDLIYHTGGDSGFGSLEIDFSYEIIDTILHISLDLEYDPVLIRPIYIGGEISIRIHPDYDFLLISAG